MKKSDISSVIRKVPEITAFFWIIKLLTTAMGETTSDYLAHVLNPITAVLIGGIGFIVAIIIQFSIRRYVAWIYWLTAAMVAIFGTMVADVLHVGFGIPYLVSTIFFSIVLIVIFGIWYRFEKTLSVHTINTRRREIFYWATVITTFALGTAVGDLTAVTMNLGYLISGVMFALLISLPALGYWLFGLNEIPAFWIAYILTRPLGASFADWAGKPQNLSGLGLGTGQVSLYLIILIVILVEYLSITHRDAKRTS